MLYVSSVFLSNFLSFHRALAAWAVWALVVDDISVTVLVLRTRQGVLDNTHSP
jgi:hypothetical protein